MCSYVKQRGSQTARKWSHLIFIKLITAKGGHAGFDTAGAQSDEEEADHGQRAGCERKHADERYVFCRKWRKDKKKNPKTQQTLSDAGLHVKGHVVRLSVPVGVSYVGNGTDCHGNLAQRIDDGQVDDSPAKGKKDESVKYGFGKKKCKFNNRDLREKKGVHTQF